MIQSRNKFLLSAQVAGAEPEDQTIDGAQAGHLIERRLNRVERVVSTYHGQIESRSGKEMLVTFETANRVALAACEMQHRCAALPQLTRQPLALRIGVHQGLIRQRQQDNDDNSVEVVKRLARIDDTILFSREVTSNLAEELRRFVHPFELAGDPEIFTLDWREIPSGSYGEESFRPANPYVQLHYGLKVLEVSSQNPVVTIGRDATSHMVLSDIHASRNHCRIEYTDEGILLIDSSTNGTTVINQEKQEILVKNSRLALKESGMLFFGRQFKGDRRGGIRFENF
jgi:hypothetical protein